MAPILLILAVFIQFQNIFGLGISAATIKHKNNCNKIKINVFIVDLTYITTPKKREFCEADAFISSKPINGKVYLAPWLKTDRGVFDWYQVQGYCKQFKFHFIAIKRCHTHALRK